MGEQICAVLAETRAAALEGARRVRVDYEDLPAVFDVEEAIEAAPFKKEGPNYFVYEGHHCRRIRFGDVEKGFAQADHIIEERYESSPIEHAPVETTGCTAKPEGNGRITVHTDTQALYFTLDNMALILDVPFNKLRLVGGTVGGGFGGKVDVIVEPIAALGAMLTNRPVKYVYSRPEEMQVSSPRAAERLYIKDGVMNDGRIVARQVTLYVDAGAYCRHSTYGTTKAAAHMPGPYSIPNVHVDAWCVYTNRTPSSAMRGFGVTIGDFALESHMDAVARHLKMDPIAAPPPQRLPRRRHEGAPQEGRGRGAGRGDPGRRARDRPRPAGAVPRHVLDAAGGLRWPGSRDAGSPRSTIPPA